MQTAIREISPPEAQHAPRGRRDPDRRPRAGRVGRRPHRRRAVHPARRQLDQIDRRAVPDKDTEIVLYCRSGARSGPRHRRSSRRSATRTSSTWPAGSSQWQADNLPIEAPATLTPAQQSRYSRHLLIPEVGTKGQAKLLDSKVLLIGAGGLGSPAALYLAAAGVGTLGIVDFDVVEASNLQRQVIHSTERLGVKKVDSARQTIEALNPDVKVVTYDEMLLADNVERLIAGYDVILDGTDTFETRYLLNDAAVAAGIPVVARLGLPVRGPAHDLRAVRGPVLPLPLPDPAAAGARARLLRGRRPRRRARDHGPAPGERGPQGPPRDRRAARRAAAAVRCARRLVLRAAPRRAIPSCPTCSDEARAARERGEWQAAGRVRRGPAVRARRRSAAAIGGRRAMSTVKLPSVLRAQANGERAIEVEGATIGDAVQALVGRHPALAEQLLTPEGELHRFVNVYLNGRDVRYLGGLATPVEERDEIRLLPAIAGGSMARCERDSPTSRRARPRAGSVSTGSSNRSAARRSSRSRGSRRAPTSACSPSSRPPTRPARSRIASRAP